MHNAIIGLPPDGDYELCIVFLFQLKPVPFVEFAL